MEPEELREFWKLAEHEIPRTSGGKELLEAVLKEDRSFRHSILLRDAREIAASLVAAAGYILCGHWLAPGSRAILVAAVLILLPAWFMVVDRIIQRRREARFGAALRETVERSLGSVDHQILLLRTMLWWYLLPPSAAVTIFVARLTLFAPYFWYGNVPFFVLMLAFCTIVDYAIWRINQTAVAKELAPRSEKLKAVLAELEPANLQPGETA
ncbi:MAG: hypothetical protein ACYTAN_18250 [Planctomycetota bacterium]|jgi:hypothetical protein